MKFEIINPSDKAYIEGDFDVCCIATLLFGHGYYGLKQVDGKLEMPVLLFGAEEWFKSEFNKSVKEVFDDLSREELSAALQSVHLAGERSSLNDFTSLAHRLAADLLKGRPESEV